MNRNIILSLSLAILFSCTSTTDEPDISPAKISFSLKSEIIPMKGETESRISIDGKKFLANDLIRMKLITPYDKTASHSAEFGENVSGSTMDNYYILLWNGSWVTNGAEQFNFDLNGDGKYGDSAPNLPYLSQQTPYVFTANTWERCLGILIGTKWKVFFKNTFYADQSIEANYRASDLLWAQTIMQTCTSEVTLSFHHVMSALLITIPDNIDNPSLTLEGMPNIDQQQVVVGNYYANADYTYNDKFSFSSISYVSEKSKNGTVTGIAGINNSGYYLTPFASIAQDATYYALKTDNTHYRIIIPPIACSESAKLVLRNGTDKYEYPLKNYIESDAFQANTCYPITLKIN